MNLKLCMIGCGNFARETHGPAQLRCRVEQTDLELAACCDVDETRARSFARDFGYARSYRDAATMLAKERPTAVVLAVPPPATCEAACPVLERGVPLLLEKPPGLVPAELERLIDAVAKGGAGAQVAFNRRTMPVFQQARTMLAAGLVLDSAARVDYVMDRFDRWDPDFSTTAIHGLDAVLFLAGSPLRAAELRFQAVRQGPRETANVVLEGECVSGCRVSLSLRPVTGFNLESALVHTTGQALKIRFPYPPDARAEGSVEHWRGNKLVASFSDDRCDLVEKLGVCNETRAFLGAVRTGGGFTPALTECRQQVALMEAIRLRQVGEIRFAGP